MLLCLGCVYVLGYATACTWKFICRISSQFLHPLYQLDLVEDFLLSAPHLKKNKKPNKPNKLAKNKQKQKAKKKNEQNKNKQNKELF